MIASLCDNIVDCCVICDDYCHSNHKVISSPVPTLLSREPVYHINKMAANGVEDKNSIANELINLFKRIDYDETICTLKNFYAVPIENFTSLEIWNLFDLDTSKCFIGAKKVKFNIHCLYDIFGSYCNKSKWEIKDLMRKEIENNWHWFDRATSVCLSWKDTNFNNWFKKQKFKNAVPDEVTLYALNVLLCHHTVVYNMFHPWRTISYKPGLSANVMDEACET